MSDLATQVIAFLIVLGPLVMLHELGHFVSAKRAGIRVQEFGLGFPPRARKLWRGMGRLRIGAEWVHSPRNFKFPSGLQEGAVVEARAEEVKGRLLLRSIEIVDAEKEGAVTTPLKVADADTIRLRGEVAFFDPGTDYSLNWLPIGGFVRMLGEEDPSKPDSFAAAPKRWRAAVLLTGPGMNLLAALVIFTLAYWLGQPVADKVEVVIDKVAPGAPAEKAGLLPDMAILAVDGIAVDEAKTLTAYTRAHLGETIELTVRDADGALRTIDVYARPQPPQDEGPIGITIDHRALSYKIVSNALPEAMSRAVESTRGVLDGMITLPRQLLAGEIGPELVRPVGPAGIAQISGYALEESIERQVWFPILSMAAAISVALAFTNLLPLPALDGGRLVFVLIEAIRGRRIAPEKEAVVHFAGMMFLLALAVLITIQDVSNPIPNPF